MINIPQSIRERIDALVHKTRTRITNVQSAICPTLKDISLERVYKYVYDGFEYPVYESKTFVFLSEEIPFVYSNLKHDVVFMEKYKKLVLEDKIVPFILFYNGKAVPWSAITVIHDHINSYLKIYGNYSDSSINTLKILTLPNLRLVRDNDVISQLGSGFIRYGEDNNILLDNTMHLHFNTDGIIIPDDSIEKIGIRLEFVHCENILYFKNIDTSEYDATEDITFDDLEDGNLISVENNVLLFNNYGTLTVNNGNYIVNEYKGAYNTFRFYRRNTINRLICFYNKTGNKSASYLYSKDEHINKPSILQNIKNYETSAKLLEFKTYMTNELDFDYDGCELSDHITWNGDITGKTVFTPYNAYRMTSEMPVRISDLYNTKLSYKVIKHIEIPGTTPKDVELNYDMTITPSNVVEVVPNIVYRVNTNLYVSFTDYEHSEGNILYHGIWFSKYDLGPDPDPELHITSQLMYTTSFDWKPVDVDYTVNLDRIANQITKYDYALWNDVYKELSPVKSYTYTGKQFKEMADEYGSVNMSRHHSDLIEDVGMMFVNSMLSVFSSDIIHKMSVIKFPTFGIMDGDHVEIIIFEKCNNLITTIDVPNNTTPVYINPKYNLEDCYIMSEICADPDYPVAQDPEGRCQYICDIQSYTRDNNNNYKITFVDNYYGYDLKLVPKRQFRHYKFTECEGSNMLLLPTMFNYCHDMDRYLVFINGYRVERDGYTITIMTKHNPYSKLYLSLATILDDEDYVDVYYVPEELKELYLEDQTTDRGYLTLSEPNNYPKNYAFSKYMNMVFINGLKINPLDIKDVHMSAMIINTGLANIYNVAILEYVNGNEDLKNYLYTEEEGGSVVAYYDGWKENVTSAQLAFTGDEGYEGLEKIYGQLPWNVSNNSGVLISVFSAKARSLAGSVNNITSFVRSTTEPPTGIPVENIAEEGSLPVYMWFADGILYYFTYSNKVVFDRVRDMFYMWTSLESVPGMSDIIVNVSTANVPISEHDTYIGCDNMFKQCYALTDISGMANFNFSAIKSTQYMLAFCTSLSDLTGVEDWDTSHVENMYAMFNNDSAITSLQKLSSWNVSNVTTINSMFGECSGLTSLNGLANWDVSKVTSFMWLFRRCTVLTDISALTNWDTGNVEIMQFAFSECSQLTDISPLANWNVSKVKQMYGMFQGKDTVRNAIADLTPLADWKPDNAINISYMFNHTSVSDASPLNTWRFTFDSDRRVVRNYYDIIIATSAVFDDALITSATKYPSWHPSYSPIDIAGDKPTNPDPVDWTGEYISNGYVKPSDDKVKVTGPVGGIYAGEYVAIYSLMPGYEWSDHTTSAVTITLTINRVSAGNKPSNTSPSKVYARKYLDNDYHMPLVGILKTDESEEGGTNVGHYSAEYYPDGNHKWSDNTIDHVPVTLTITAKLISSEDITIADIPNYSYDGIAKCPEPTVKDGTEALAKNTEFTYSYSNNTKASTESALAYVIVTGTGNYYGTKNKSFIIEPIYVTSKPAENVPAVTWDGQVHSNGYDIPTGIEKVRGTEAASDPGVYTAYYKPKTNYAWSGGSTGELSSTFTISPLSTPPKPTKTEVTYTYLNGYSYCYRVDEGYNYPGVYIVEGDNGDRRENVGTQTFHFALSTGYTWSDGTTSQVAVTMTVARRNIANVVMGEALDQTYTGSPICPKPGAFDYNYEARRVDLVENQDFTYSWANNIEPGIATLTISGIGNYYGSQSNNFYILVPAICTLYLDYELYQDTGGLLGSSTSGMDVYADAAATQYEGTYDSNDNPISVSSGKYLRAWVHHPQWIDETIYHMYLNGVEQPGGVVQVAFEDLHFVNLVDDLTDHILTIHGYFTT